MSRRSVAFLILTAVFACSLPAAAQLSEVLSEQEALTLANRLMADPSVEEIGKAGTGGSLSLAGELAASAAAQGDTESFSGTFSISADRSFTSYAEAQAALLYRSMQDAFLGSWVTSDACERKGFRNYGISKSGKNACAWWCERTRYPFDACYSACEKKLDSICYDKVG